MALGMLKKTSRWIFDESSSGATAPRIPEMTVMVATPRPRMIGIQDGLSVRLGVGRLAMGAKPTAQWDRGRNPAAKRPERPKPLMRHGLGVGLGQPFGHRREQLVGQPPHLVEQPAELALAEHEQSHVGLGHDGGVPGPADEKGQLTEVLARTQCVDLAAVLLDDGIAIEDQKELVPGRAFLDQNLAGGRGDLIRRPSDLGQLLLRQGRKEPHLREVVQLGVLRHGGKIATRGGRASRCSFVLFTPAKQTRNVRCLASLSVDVVLIRWPFEGDRRDRLAGESAPRLLLLEEGVPPPDPTDCLEDWIRVPASEVDVRARVAALAFRAETHTATAPVLDRDGVLRFGSGWVSLPPVEARLTGAMLGRFGAVVSREALSQAGWPEGAPGRNALDVHVLRLRRRLVPLSLVIRTVRSRGYLLEAAAADQVTGFVS